MKKTNTYGRKTYSELKSIDDYFDRFEYLKLHGDIGDRTFGSYRYVNQNFYTSRRWKSVRSEVIIRDGGCDLGIDTRPIIHRANVHHINPITIDDILDENPCVFDLDNLICVSSDTHKAIHYGDKSLLIEDYVPRRPGDTTLW